MNHGDIRDAYIWWLSRPMDFNNWLHEMDQFFEQVGLSDNKKVGFPKMKLIGRALNYWNDIENHHYGLYKPVINDWKEMKEKLREEYLPQSYRKKYPPPILSR